ncbi:MAG: NADH-quinone oxidoreductase subunit C [Mariprofundaceae bacterium]
MSQAVNTWFAEQLGEHGIYNRYLDDHHPARMPCLQIRRLDWEPAAELAKQLQMRFTALWAAEAGSHNEKALYAYMAFAHPQHRHVILRTDLNSETSVLPSISHHYIAAMRKERTLQDMFGIQVDGIPDTRPWIKHEHWPEDAHPLRSTFKASAKMAFTEGEYSFIKAEGDGVYEIPVGPVHAGIIEPGHFRFLAVGEQILNLEQRLGYVHKGIEKRMEGMRADDAAKIAARISGDATVAYSWAFARACEHASYSQVPDRANAIRAILCERERMANHIGDIGAICNDAAFAFIHVQMQRLREEMARLHKQLFGHRLLMDMIVPGGIKLDLDVEGMERLVDQTTALAVEVEELRGLYADHPSIQERVIGSGAVSIEDAKTIGLTGYVGRASGVYADERVEEAYPPYDRLDVQVPEGRLGDVATRVWVRFEEIAEAARIISTLLGDLPDGHIANDWQPPVAGVSGFSSIESWRGEITCWLRFGENGAIDRGTFSDPSVVNWLGLELAVRDVPVPDFPLNNKSFNCSYSGNDL